MEKMVGLGALLAAIIEVLKKLGVIPDGYAGLAAAIANVVVFAVIEIAIGFFDIDLTTLDGILAMIAALVTAIAGSLLTHKAGRAMKVW